MPPREHEDNKLTLYLEIMLQIGYMLSDVPCFCFVFSILFCILVFCFVLLPYVIDFPCLYLCKFYCHRVNTQLQ
jgi:hypothetical protein